MANCAVMLLRIVYAGSLIRSFFPGQSMRAAFPAPAVLAAFGAAFAVTRASEWHRLSTTAALVAEGGSGSAVWLIPATIHIGVGIVLLVQVLATVWVSELGAIRQLAAVAADHKKSD